ncbi:hypothetical protein ACFLT7_01575 [candidate division KSB1 bacterium]
MNPVSAQTISSQTQGWDFGAGPGLFWFLLFVLISVCLLLFWTSPRNRLGPAVVVLRLVSLLLLGLLLFKPSFNLTRTVDRKPKVLALLDRSASMNVADLHRDSLAGPAVPADSPGLWLTRWETAHTALAGAIENGRRSIDFSLSPFPETTDGPLESDPENWSPPDGAFTDLGGILSVTVERSEELDAVLLVSDGNHNHGPDPVAAAARSGVPIYPVPVGGTTPAPELEVVTIEAAERAALGESVPVKVVIRSRRLGGMSTMVSLLDGGSVLDSVAVGLTDSEIDRELELKFKPDRVGLRQLTVTARQMEGEMSLDNNRRNLLIRIMPRKTRVLVAFGRPGFELRFIRLHLENLENIEVRSLLHTGSGRLVGLDDGEVEFDTEKYDVIILGDMTRDELPPHMTQRIADWLAATPGAALVLLGTRTLSQGPEQLLALSPLRLPSGALGSYSGVSLSPLGMLRLSVAGGGDPIAALPPVWVPRSTYQLSPGARVLARIAPGDEASPPVVAYQSRGSAHIAAVALDGLWRWAFLPLGVGQTDDYYAGFWRRLVNWLALPEGMNRLAVEPEGLNFHSAESVRFLANLFDRDLIPLTDGEILLRWRREASDGDNRSVTGTNVQGDIYFQPVDGSSGQYRADIGALPPGNYVYTAIAGQGEGEIGRTLGAFGVNRYSREEAGLPANRNLLRRIAEITGGRLLELDSLDIALTGLKLEGRKVRTTIWFDAPRGPFVLVVIVIALSLEWLLRRRRGLR